MSNELCLACAITFMSFAGPITAAIMTRPRKHADSNGNGFSTRELAVMSSTLNTLVLGQAKVEQELKQIWEHIRGN